MTTMNTQNSSYAKKVDSIFAIIKSYEQEPQKQKQKDEVVVDSNANAADVDADVIDANSRSECRSLAAAANAKFVKPELSHAADVARHIEQQVNGMRLQIESASVQIELLHVLRASEESNHTAAMNSLREKWKQGIKDAKVQHDHATFEQAKINEDLAKQHKALKKEEASLKLSLERII
eukprot:scaffold221_cov93-Skeletonema_marinoi.AAC.1